MVLSVLFFFAIAAFSDSWIGITLAISFVIDSLMAPMYGALADAREQRHPNWGRSQVLLAGVILGTICFLLHGISNLTSPATTITTDTTYSDRIELVYHFVVQCMYAFCFAVMFPVLDGMTLDFLHNQHGESTKDYGKERLFGAASWGITNLLMGPMLDRFGFLVLYPCAIASAIYCAVTIWIYSKAQESSSLTLESQTFSSGAKIEDHLPKEEIKDGDDDAASAIAGSWKLLCLVMGTCYGAAFVACYFVLATGFSVVENLVFLFFEFLGGSNTICAITVALTVVFEIPMFRIAPSLLRNFGVGWMLLLANGAFFIRIVGYTLIPQGQSWWVFFLEPLHGLTYAGSQSAAVEYVNQHMPAGKEASGQGIILLVRGSGGVLGLWLGGVLEDSLGPRTMYRIFATVTVLGMTVFATIRQKYRHQEEEGYRRIGDIEGSVTV